MRLADKDIAPDVESVSPVQSTSATVANGATSVDGDRHRHGAVMVHRDEQDGHVRRAVRPAATSTRTRASPCSGRAPPTDLFAEGTDPVGQTVTIGGDDVPGGGRARRGRLHRAAGQQRHASSRRSRRCATPSPATARSRASRCRRRAPRHGDDGAERGDGDPRPRCSASRRPTRRPTASSTPRSCSTTATSSADTFTVLLAAVAGDQPARGRHRRHEHHARHRHRADPRDRHPQGARGRGAARSWGSSSPRRRSCRCSAARSGWLVGVRRVAASTSPAPSPCSCRPQSCWRSESRPPSGCSSAACRPTGPRGCSPSRP